MSEEVLGQIAEDLGDNEVRLAYGEELAKLDFALALAKARKESDLTQQQLAEQLGVSQAYVARLESGLANPTVGKVGSIFASLWKRPSISLDSLVRQKEQIASLPNGPVGHPTTTGRKARPFAVDAHVDNATDKLSDIDTTHGDGSWPEDLRAVLATGENTGVDFIKSGRRPKSGSRFRDPVMALAAD
jgi:transcriptional regulator with XRE-family HTH domain